MNSKDLKRKLILYRLMYYYPEKVKEDKVKELTISDAEYDKLEIEYSKLCKEEGCSNLFDRMVELEFKRVDVITTVYPYIKEGYI